MDGVKQQKEKGKNKTTLEKAKESLRKSGRLTLEQRQYTPLCLFEFNHEIHQLVVDHNH